MAFWVYPFIIPVLRRFDRAAYCAAPRFTDTLRLAKPKPGSLVKPSAAKTAPLEDSLLALHGSVARLITMIQENAAGMEREREILNKLPLLDFYNDDLLRNISAIRIREQ